VELLGVIAVALLATGKVACFAVAVRNALRPRPAATASSDGQDGDDRQFGPVGDDAHEFPLLPEHA